MDFKDLIEQGEWQGRMLQGRCSSQTSLQEKPAIATWHSFKARCRCVLL